MNKVSWVDLVYVYAAVIMRLVLALVIGGFALVWGQYAYSGYQRVAQQMRADVSESEQIYLHYCTAVDAPDDRRFSPTCLTARERLRVDADLRHQIVLQWMQEHMAHLPGFGWCLGFPSCFHAATHAVSHLLSVWFLLKLAGVAFLLLTIANTVLFVRRNAYPMTQEFRAQKFVALPATS
jgi:hypothetical protein